MWAPCPPLLLAATVSRFPGLFLLLGALCQGVEEETQGAAWANTAPALAQGERLPRGSGSRLGSTHIPCRVGSAGSPQPHASSASPQGLPWDPGQSLLSCTPRAWLTPIHPEGRVPQMKRALCLEAALRTLPL